MSWDDYVDYMKTVSPGMTDEEIEESWYDIPSKSLHGIDFDDDCDDDPPYDVPNWENFQCLDTSPNESLTE